MQSRKLDLKVIGPALLLALGVSVGVLLACKAVGIPDATGERISQILFFPIFLGACHARRRGIAVTSTGDPA